MIITRVELNSLEDKRSNDRYWIILDSTSANGLDPRITHHGIGFDGIKAMG